ncbi:MAG: tetratricopeptide repeat protein, partial [Candidatus Obscuribacterales bacterium]|nr:tetratricopeptide repeat protein [Candidatus Obscuribacterales bacterium]
GNYSVTKKLRDLQAYYTKHKPKKIAREAWVYSKLAYYEWQHGTKEKANLYCNSAIKDLSAPLAEPIDLESGAFYVEATESLARALKGLNRIPDFNRIVTKYSSGRVFYGRDKTQRDMFDGVVYFLEGDMDSSRAKASDAIKGEPGYAGSYYLRAIAGMRADTEEAYNSAIKDLDKAIAICPDFPHAYLMKGICLLENKKTDEALVAFDKALSQSHGRPTFYILRGVARAEKGDIAGCEADLDEAIKDPEVSWVAYAVRGECHMFHRQYELAIKDYTSEINGLGFKLNKVKAKAYYRRGTAYLKLQNQDKANDDLKQCVILDPSRADKVKKLTAKLVEDDEKVTSTDEESFRKIVAESDPDLPSFREGEGKVFKSKSSRLASRNKSAPKGKPSWIIDDAPSSTATGDKSATNSSPTDGSTSSGSANGGAGSGGSASGGSAGKSASSVNIIDVDEDPYLKYINKHIRSFVESAPSRDLKVTFKVESDGVATIQEEAGVKPSNMLSNLVLMAAPYKIPPAGKPSIFSVEMKATSTQVKVDYK